MIDATTRVSATSALRRSRRANGKSVQLQLFFCGEAFISIRKG
jgi:hypothetical protein